MERTHRRSVLRAGLGAVTALVMLLATTGTCVASGAVEPVRLAAMAQAAPLAEGVGYGATAEAERVRVLQRTLRGLGWAPGPVDGLFGPRTEAAVLRFQAASGLTVDGAAGPQVWTALARAQKQPLRRGAGYAAANGSQRVRALQRRLQRRGLRPGPVDGLYGPRTEAAVARLQRAAELKVSGAADVPTRRVLARDSQPRAAERPVSASVDAILPQTRRITAIVPLSGVAGDAGQGVEPWLTALIALMALLLGAVIGGLIARARGKEEKDTPDQAEGLVSADEEQDPEPAEAFVTSAGPREAVRAVGYVSVPKANGDDSAELESQADAIQRLCERRGWELLHVVRDVENGHAKGMDRPGLLYALERIAEGEASCLVVSELGRLSRNAADLGRIVEWCDERDARLIAIDMRLDTGSASGRLTARTLTMVGEWEGQRIAEQTRKGLAAARARRATTGRPAVEDRPDLKEWIVAMRNEGMTLQAIADRLNAESVPTLRGGSEWRPSSVQAAAGYRRPKGKRGNGSERRKGDAA
jgi:DNA invertase Pin-like site-specific DNA recombinase/peptidoglycan hydrolase-like protein with peptidoglycan-binding domain